MRSKIRLLLVVGVSLTLTLTTQTAYAFCTDAFFDYQLAGTWIQIKGTHYAAAGATKVVCDTRLGDSLWGYSCITCSSPPSLDVQIVAANPACEPIEALRYSFHTDGVWGSEIQVVKNGVAKNQCAFHGATNYGTSSSFEYWYASTIKSFDAAGNPTTERGTLSFNTDDGRIFIGKITIKYPKP